MSVETVIEHEQREWAVPVVSAPKKASILRFCVDHPVLTSVFETVFVFY